MGFGIARFTDAGNSESPDKSYLRRRVRFEGVAEDLVFAVVVVVHALPGVVVVRPVA